MVEKLSMRIIYRIMVHDQWFYNLLYLEQFYMRPKVNSNQFEMLFCLHGNFTTAKPKISNPFQKLLCLHGDFTAATFKTIVRF